MSARRKLGERPGTAADIVHTVDKHGGIEEATLHRLLKVLRDHTAYPHHVTVEVRTGALLKTIDNQADALATIERIEASVRVVRPADYPHCQAGRDGECNWTHCPQLRDGEPARSRRHCPKDTRSDDE